jgi:hypothetical protein
MRLSDFLDDIGRPLAYYPQLALCLGSVNATILLCQLFYWDGKQADEEGGWIYKTQAEITEETGLTRRESDTARKVLREKKVLTDKLRGVPPKIHFLINRKALDDLWDSWRFPPNHNGGKRQINLAESAKLDLAESAKTSRRNAPKQLGVKRQNIKSETTPETTSETTREHTHTAAPAQGALPLEDDSVCVSRQLRFEDYLSFARSQPSFHTPDAWAMKHYPLRDADALVAEWLESQRPEKVAAARAEPPSNRKTFGEAADYIRSILSIDADHDVQGLIRELDVDEGVRARLIEKFIKAG